MGAAATRWTTSVGEEVYNGHKVPVQSGAGEVIGCTDATYRDSGARIVSTAKTVFAETDLIGKVKEPQL